MTKPMLSDLLAIWAASLALVTVLTITAMRLI